jgi:hypothetical protein
LAGHAGQPGKLHPTGVTAAARFDDLERLAETAESVAAKPPQRLVIQHGREWVGLGVIADNVVNIGHAIKKPATS